MPSFLGTKKNREACGDLDGMMHPIFRCSLMKVLHISISKGFKE